MNSVPGLYNTVMSLDSVGLAYKVSKSSAGNQLYWVLRDVSFDLYKGETLGIIGRNAAGKSTLLRMLAGIIEPDRGEMKCYVRNISLLSLRAGFNPHLTGRENAIMSGILLGLRRKEVERRLGSIIEFSELGDFIDMPLRSYSSGMQTRLGFAVGIYVDPDVLLIDEALEVGDAEFRKKSGEKIREKVRSDRTVVFVSHNVKAIESLCDRAVWIEEGVSKMQGPTKEVTASYGKYMRSLKKGNAPIRARNES